MALIFMIHLYENLNNRVYDKVGITLFCNPQCPFFFFFNRPQNRVDLLIKETLASYFGVEFMERFQQ